MKCLLLSICVLAAIPVTAQQPAAAKADETGVREIVQRYTQAREANDPRTIEALFTADADQYTSAGEWRRGLPAVVKGMLATSASNPGIRAITVQAVRFVTPDVAIVDGEYRTGTGAQRLWTTLIVTRQAKGWRIAGIRNMAPPGQAK